MNTMHVEDYIVLGRTVPEDSKKFGKKICMAGYSQENSQFLRVYPLMVPVGENADANGFKARHVYTLDLRRNPNDSRGESWRLVDEQKPTTTIWARATEIKKEPLVDMLRKRVVSSIKTLNDCKLSLGVLIVKSSEWEGYAVAREEPSEDNHRGLFDDLADQADLDANQVKFAPYMRFKDSAGEHNLQVREWGAYRLLSNPKYADNPETLWGAAGYRRGRDLMLVVGNMGNHRTNWLIIKTFELDSAPSTPNLLDGFE